MEQQKRYCRNCAYQLQPFFSLGETPLVNAFLRKKDEKEKTFDLTVGYCENCYLVQLLHSISPEELFLNYIYLSSVSQQFLNHCEDIANKLTEKLSLGKNSFVFEIASNDGAQLRYFKNKGMKILGIDPAKNIAALANKRGLPTIPSFFNKKKADELFSKDHLQADLIFGANVLAHVPEIVDFLDGVKIILSKKGSAVFEFPYLRGLLENKFDIIYHEHVFYYSLIALKNLFLKANLIIYDVEETPMQGGSLLLYASHTGTFTISNSVKNMLDFELENKYHHPETYLQIGKQISGLKESALSFFRNIKKQGKTVGAYSAAAKGMTLLNYFGIGQNYLAFIVDKAVEKQGLFTPGTHMKIYPPNEIAKRNPDYIIILCWNIAEEVIGTLQDYVSQGGKIIIPVPELKIIE